MTMLTAEREALLLVMRACRELLAAAAAEGGHPPALAARLAELDREIRASTTVVVEADVRAPTGTPR